MEVARREAVLETDEDVQKFRNLVDVITNDVIDKNRFQRDKPKVVVPKVVPVLTPEQITKEKLKEGYLKLLAQRKSGDIDEKEFAKQSKEILNSLTLLGKDSK